MRSNKGTFEKGNDFAKGKKKATSFYAKSNPSAQDVIKEKKETDQNQFDYIPFGSDNLFPNTCAELFRRSAVSRAVIQSKRNYVVGKGLSSEDARFKAYKPNDKEQLEDIILKCAQDKLVTGNAYIEVVKVGQLIEIYHKDSTYARLKKGGGYVIFHPDWTKFNSTKNLSVTLPLYPNFEKVNGALRSVIHIKDYEPEFKWYGVPSNIASQDSTNIAYKTNRWNLSRLDNAFSVSGVMNIKATFSEEDAKAFKEDLESAFTGDGKAGKVLTIVDSEGAENGKTSFTPIQQNEEGNWIELHKQATEEIIVANQWFSSLAGLNVSSGFDTNRIRNDYQVAISTIIPYEQRFFIEAFYTLFKNEFGWDLTDLVFINQSPIDDEKDMFQYHIENGIVTKNEVRKRLGLEEIEDPNAEKTKQIMEQLNLLKLATDAGLTIEEAKKLVGFNLK